MRTVPPIYLLVLSAVVLAVTAVDFNEQLETDNIIEAVNTAKSTWQAGRNFHTSLNKKYLRNLLGRKKRPEGSRLPPLVDTEDEDIEIPKSFDARENWKDCISLQQVRDQGPCASCWAVAAASAFTDRLCIATKASFNGHLSAEEVLSCCADCGYGCDGGYDDATWEYFNTTGLVTGGDYKSGEGCQPYTLPICDHYVPGPKRNCSSYPRHTPTCKHVCYNKKYKDHSFTEDHHKVKSTFSISSNVKLMQKEIFKNGPLEAGLEVYEDFLSYKSGVYTYTEGKILGYLAVKVIGWGVEDGVNYWLVANSWNSDWGDQGFFKIKRGNNECGFEDAISGGYPEIP